MYQHFFNFNAEPFRLSPDHAFAYLHKGYSKAQAYMAYAFQRAEGFVMITGRPGTGKTTLIGALSDQLAGEDVTTANLVCTQLNADDLLKMVAYEFGISQSVVEKGELLHRLTQQLKSWHRDARRALLIVDEAQDLSASAMEELRLLTNIQVDSKPLLQIFLLGQPELRELILSPQMEQVHQRIIAASHLHPLESDETGAYVRHRLESVGWRGDPAISEAVYPLIHKFSEGIPRRINLICSRLLLHCAVDQRHRILVADFREVIAELQEEDLAAGSTLCDQDFEVAAIMEVKAGRDLNIGAQAAAGGVASGAAISVDKRPAERTAVRVSQQIAPAIPQKKNADQLKPSRLKVVAPDKLENRPDTAFKRARVCHANRANEVPSASARPPQQGGRKSATAMRRERNDPVQTEARYRSVNKAVMSTGKTKARSANLPEVAEADDYREDAFKLTEPYRRVRNRNENKSWPTVVVLAISASFFLFGILGMLGILSPLREIVLSGF